MVAEDGGGLESGPKEAEEGVVVLSNGVRCWLERPDISACNHRVSPGGGCVSRGPCSMHLTVMVADDASSSASVQDRLPLSHLGMRRLLVPGVHHT